MKVSFLLLISFCFYLNSNAQTSLSEPDFIGEVMAVSADGEGVTLEKVRAQVKVKDLLMGFEKKIYVQGKKSPIRLAKGKIQLIVRAVDNNTDPMSIIRVFKFSVEKTRKATVAKQNEITGNVSENHFKHVPFSGKKYGTGSYLLTISNIEKGEYGITINNPNTVDEKMLIVSCFGVDE
jgi:hypothetical protein